MSATKVKQLKSVADSALEDPEVKAVVHHVFVAKRTETDVHLAEEYDVDLDKVSI